MLYGYYIQILLTFSLCREDYCMVHVVILKYYKSNSDENKNLELNNNYIKLHTVLRCNVKLLYIYGLCINY